MDNNMQEQPRPKPDFSSLTLNELEQRFYEMTDADDDAFSDIEQEIFQRQGGYVPVADPDTSKYTVQTQEAYEKDLKAAPFYISSPQEIDSDDSRFLCNTCRHLDFCWMLKNMVPVNELTLGMLEDIWKKDACAFCRLVRAAISITLDVSSPPHHPGGREIEVGLRTWNRSHDGSRFDLRIDLHPLATASYPQILLQQLSEAECLEKDQGRVIDSRAMDIDQINQVLESCSRGIDGHENASLKCTHTQPYRPKYIIDTDKGCIVDATDTSRYVALSYVWGGQQQLQLTSKNIKMLKAAGSLALTNRQIPATIRDAMQLTVRLGMRFLWVDVFCIVQDDSLNKHSEIAAMDKVYGNAALTLIAASTTTAHDGIPGVSARFRKRHQHIEHVQGVRLVNRLLLMRDAVDRSAWNSRAWTYQERILSRRKLFMTDVQWIYLCEHSEVGICEDVHPRPLRPSQRSWDTTGASRGEKWPAAYEAQDTVIPRTAVNTALYSKIVEKATSRNVSFPKDVLNAFEGVANVLSQLFRDGFMFGIPSAELDTQLLWQPTGQLKRRVDSETGQTIFPSWSWAGWEGIVRCKAGLPHSCPKIEVLVTSIRSKKMLHVDMTTYRQADIERWHYERWRIEAYWREEGSKDTYYAHPLRTLDNPKEYELSCPTIRGRDCLQFYAYVSRLEISGGDLNNSLLDVTTENADTHGRRAFSLRTTNELQVGYVIVPESVTHRLRPGLYDCVQISLTDTSADAPEDSTELIAWGGYLDRTLLKPRKKFECRIANILVIEWDAAHEVASRIGAGCCHASVFQGSHATRTLIHLG